MREEDFAATLDAIYAAAVSPDQWTAALAAMGTVLHCNGLATISRAHNRLHYRAVAHGVDREAHQAFLRRWHRTNPLGTRVPIKCVGEVLRFSQIMPKAEFVRSEIFADYFNPHAFHHGLRLSIWHSASAAQSVTMLRPGSRDDFDDGDIALARRLIPHLHRAAAVNRHLRLADLMSSAAFAALDGLRHPVLLLDECGRVAHANSAGERLLGQGDGLDITEGGLSAPQQAPRARLQAMVGRAVGGGGLQRQAGLMRLARPTGGPDLILIAMPLNADRDWDVPGRPTALLCIVDPSLGARLSPDMLSALFGLTAAEAMLASDLLDGGTPIEIARRTGRSLATVRTHLARLLAKTGTRRQPDLTRLLAALPATSDGTAITDL